jgi:hypothetical protein
MTRTLAVCGLLAVVSGCGRGNGLPMVPVSGQVTFAGGPCPAPGTVNFSPVAPEPGLPRRPASGTFQSDGRFVATSFSEGDGLVPGTYRISISCDSGLPNPWSKDPWGDVSYVPKGFQPPELVVAVDSDAVELAYDVPPKKKK